MSRRRGSKAEDLVANRYKKAGYEVRKHLMTSAGEVDILARRGREKYAVEVKSGKQVVTSKEILKIYRKAKALRAKPKMKLTSRQVKITNTARELARKLGVSIDRIGKRGKRCKR